MLTTIVQWLAVRIEILSVDGERGASAVEYGLLVGLIAIAIIAGVTALGTRLDEMFCGVAGQLPFGTASCS